MEGVLGSIAVSMSHEKRLGFTALVSSRPKPTRHGCSILCLIPDWGPQASCHALLSPHDLCLHLCCFLTKNKTLKEKCQKKKFRTAFMHSTFQISADKSRDRITPWKVNNCTAGSLCQCSYEPPGGMMHFMSSGLGFFHDSRDSSPLLYVNPQGLPQIAPAIQATAGVNHN